LRRAKREEEVEEERRDQNLEGEQKRQTSSDCDMSK
jgi:hypothetical protein